MIALIAAIVIALIIVKMLCGAAKGIKEVASGNVDQKAQFTVWVIGGLVAVLALLGRCSESARADDKRPQQRRQQQHNYIVERQQVYTVQGVPTQRILSGGRQIDVYRSGQMFEGNNMVGVRK